MRKRWRLILGVLALIVVLAIAWPKPPDGYAFLEKYHPIRKMGPDPWSIEEGAWMLTFTFPRTTPELLADLGLPPDFSSKENFMYPQVRLPNGKEAFYSAGENMLSVFGVSDTSWISRQWDSFMRFLRFRT